MPKNRDRGEKVGVHAKLRHGSPRLKWAFSVAVQALLKTKRGRFVVMSRRLEKRPGRPKALMAVAQRLAFTVYGIWKTGQLYEEGSPSLDKRKRAQLARRATKRTTLPSRGELIDKLIRKAARPGRPTCPPGQPTSPHGTRRRTTRGVVEATLRAVVYNLRRL